MNSETTYTNLAYSESAVNFTSGYLGREIQVIKKEMVFKVYNASSETQDSLIASFGQYLCNHGFSPEAHFSEERKDSETNKDHSDYLYLTVPINEPQDKAAIQDAYDQWLLIQR